MEIAASWPYRLSEGTQGVEIVTPLGVTTLLGVNLISFDPTSINLV